MRPLKFSQGFRLFSFSLDISGKLEYAYIMRKFIPIITIGLLCVLTGCKPSTPILFDSIVQSPLSSANSPPPVFTIASVEIVNVGAANTTNFLLSLTYPLTAENSFWIWCINTSQSLTNVFYFPVTPTNFSDTNWTLTVDNFDITAWTNGSNQFAIFCAASNSGGLGLLSKTFYIPPVLTNDVVTVSATNATTNIVVSSLSYPVGSEFWRRNPTNLAIVQTCANLSKQSWINVYTLPSTNMALIIVQTLYYK